MKVAADHDHAVADAAVNREAAADDDGGVGDLFVALDADVLAKRDAGSREPIRGRIRGLRPRRALNTNHGQGYRQQRVPHRHLNKRDDAWDGLVPPT